jgi:hypothetical protein
MWQNMLLPQIKVRSVFYSSCRKDIMNNFFFSLRSTFGSLHICCTAMCRGVRGKPIRCHMGSVLRLTLRSYYLTHSWGLDWWAPGRVHMPVGHDHCTSGAPTCSEICRSACSCKVSSFCEPLRRGIVLMKERLYTDWGRLPHTPFCPGASQRQILKARRTTRHLLYTTLHFNTTLDASLHHVVTPHGPLMNNNLSF